MVAPAGPHGNEALETTGLEKPEKGGPGHEGLTVEPGQKGEKVK